MFKGLFERATSSFCGPLGSIRPARKASFDARLSQTTLLRLAEFNRRSDLQLDPKIARLLPKHPLNKETLLAAIEVDIERDFKRLKELIGALDEDERPSPPWEFVLTPRWKTEAAARLASSLGGRDPALTPAHLVICAGMVLKVEELLLEALCSYDYYHSNGAIDLPIPLVSAELDNQPDRADYDWIEGLSNDVTAPFLAPMPHTPWRLLQYELLRELSIQWILLHEFAHWTVGHLGLLAEILAGEKIAASLLDPGLGFSEAERTEITNRITTRIIEQFPQLDLNYEDARRAMEFSADRWGFMYLVRIHAKGLQRGNSAFDAHRRAMSSLRLSPQFASSIDLNEASRMECAVTAAATVALILEEKEKYRGVSADHPPASSRLINLFSASFGCSPFVDLTEDGISFETELTDHPDFGPYMASSFGWQIVYLNKISEILDMQPLSAISETDGSPIYSQLIEDICRTFDPTATLDSFETSAGKEAFRLRHLMSVVEAMCTPNALVEVLRL